MKMILCSLETEESQLVSSPREPEDRPMNINRIQYFDPNTPMSWRKTFCLITIVSVFVVIVGIIAILGNALKNYLRIPKYI